jgi:hypothetical protein
VSVQFPDDAQLIKMAGKAAFARGRGYYADGRVALSLVSRDAMAGEAYGTETYRLRLAHDGRDWRWNCDCPAAADGAFCKHLVAAVLAARDDVEGADEPAASQKQRHSATVHGNDLLDFLHAQPAQRLAEWLYAAALQDVDVEKRLLLYRAAEQPGALKPALAKLLNTGGFLDYRRAVNYAQRLRVVIGQLNDLLQRDPGECRALCEYALGRLFKVCVQCDDSAGAIGDVVEEIAGLHARACAEAPPGASLGKALHTLIAKDECDVIELENYWDALGAMGQANYAKALLARFERLPPPKHGSFEHDDAEVFSVCHRVEELARCSGDFDLLQRVLRRDLSSAWKNLRVIESLRNFGREREALAWAEQAIKQFPDDWQLRSALVGCLAESGMDEEALEQAWQCFTKEASVHTWDLLKGCAGEVWPYWRERALAQVMEHEGGYATLRIGLLMHEGDIDAALRLARSSKVMPGVLRSLAERLQHSHPADAGTFHLRLASMFADQLHVPRNYQVVVEHLHQASKLLPTAEWQPLAARIRAEHARKSKLMKMLTDAGL